LHGDADHPDPHPSPLVDLPPAGRAVHRPLLPRATPAILGFPFFYWYQFAWVVLTSVLLYAVYRQFKTH